MTRIGVTLIIIIGLLIIAAIGLTVVTFENMLLADLCDNEILQQNYSPDGLYKALVFERDCGATTGFSTQVSILPIDEELSDSDAGNTLICSDDFGRQEIKVEWEGNKRLKLFYSERACNLSKEAGQAEIHIVTVASP